MGCERQLVGRTHARFVPRLSLIVVGEEKEPARRQCVYPQKNRRPREDEGKGGANERTVIKNQDQDSLEGESNRRNSFRFPLLFVYLLFSALANRVYE